MTRERLTKVSKKEEFLLFFAVQTIIVLSQIDLTCTGFKFFIFCRWNDQTYCSQLELHFARLEFKMNILQL